MNREMRQKRKGKKKKKKKKKKTVQSQGGQMTRLSENPIGSFFLPSFSFSFLFLFLLSSSPLLPKVRLHDILIALNNALILFIFHFFFSGDPFLWKFFFFFLNFRTFGRSFLEDLLKISDLQ